MSERNKVLYMYCEKKIKKIKNKNNNNNNNFNEKRIENCRDSWSNSNGMLKENGVNMRI